MIEISVTTGNFNTHVNVLLIKLKHGRLLHRRSLNVIKLSRRCNLSTHSRVNGRFNAQVMIILSMFFL